MLVIRAHLIADREEPGRFTAVWRINFFLPVVSNLNLLNQIIRCLKNTALNWCTNQLTGYWEDLEEPRKPDAPDASEQLCYSSLSGKVGNAHLGEQ